MTSGSIRLRLLIAGALAVIAALVVAGIGLVFLFERHVERRFEAELRAHLDQLVAGIDIAPDGAVSVTDPPRDPRFFQPLSGLVWQVADRSSGKLVRSRSLWDGTIALPTDDFRRDGLRPVEVSGADGARFMAVEQSLHDSTAGERDLSAIVAVDHREIDQATADFAFDLVPALGMLAIVLIVAGWLQIAVGLRPLERLRQAVSEVASGGADRLSAEAPTELKPLTGEINRLLDAQAAALARARSAAADLAHGLKTPLQVLSADIRRLREKGDTAIADEIDEIAGTIRRHVERELARARAAPRRSAHCIVAEVAGRVLGVVRRTPRAEGLTFDTAAIPESLTAPIDEADLSEILGNLFENAVRFAKSVVRIEADNLDGSTRIAVSDDGPGIPAERRAQALARGGRLDLRGDGAGLGLAIVADVVEAYGGRLELEDAAPGLRAVVTLPKSG